VSGPARPGAGTPKRLRVFAVEPDRAQLTWGRLGPGPVSIVGAGPEVRLQSDGGPGAVDLHGLVAGRAYTADVRVGSDHRTVAELGFRTTTPPPGAEVGRLATISDVHLGRHSFGYLETMRDDRPGGPPTAWRCATAAVDAATEWGATRLVAKGDLVEHASHDEWAVLGDLAVHAVRRGLAVELVAGNHEVKAHRETDPGPAMARHGLEPTDGVRVVDLEGLRLLLIDTAWEDHHRGRLHHVTEMVGDVARGHRVLAAQHHFPQPGPVPHFWPPGVPWREGRRFLDTLDRASPGALVTAGHSHRHRRRTHRSVTITEVGSPKDYPGTWAGYVVHEGGVRQVVRRVDRTDCIRWTEYTRWAGLGTWGRWSPGRLHERCFSLTWPT
jgi:predicted phosphodiesterase